MGLLAKRHHLCEVLVVDVRIHAEQTLQYGLGGGVKVLWKRHADLGGKQGLVVQLVLHPSHQIVNILGRAALDGLLYGQTVGPVVLVFRTSRHDATGLLGAELGDGAVQHVDLVEKVHGCEGVAIRIGYLSLVTLY